MSSTLISIAVDNELGRVPGLQAALASAGVHRTDEVMKSLERTALRNEVAGWLAHRPAGALQCRSTLVGVAAHDVVGRRLADGIHAVTVCDGRFVRYARGRVGEHAAGDVVAETGARLHHGIWRKGRAVRRPIPAYIYGTLKNVIYDYWRDREHGHGPVDGDAFGGDGEQPPRPWDDPRPPADTMCDADADADADADERIDAAQLDRSVRALKERERAALEHYLAGGEGVPDGMTAANYRQRLSSGLVRLRLLNPHVLSQPELLAALGSSAATHMLKVADQAWLAVHTPELEAFVASLDARCERDRHAAERLLALAGRAQAHDAMHLLRRHLER